MTRHRLGVLMAALALACSDGEGPVPPPDPPTVTIERGNFQRVRYGTAVPIAPQVYVADSAGPLAGVEVVFTVTAGGGTATGTTARTTASGMAAVGGWTLGPSPGPNRLVAAVGEVEVEFEATAIAGPPAAIRIVSGDGQSASSGQVVPEPLAVEVTDGSFPVEGANVGFAVLTGGGVVEPAIGTTDANGIATTTWRLGAVGANGATATVAGLPPVSFSATAVPLVVGSVVVVSGDGGVGFAGNLSPGRPTVEVRDDLGRPARGIPVAFAVSEGGGALLKATATTAADGRASVGAWRFGAPGTQALLATVAGAPPVTVRGTATPVPVGRFDIEVQFLAPLPTPEQQAAFLAARDRWEALIVGDVPDITGSIAANSCFNPPDTPAIPGGVDDIVIFAGIVPIDGPRGILAQAGPCVGRATGPGLPAVGLVVFDEADVPLLTTGAGLADVALHEFAHALGFGIYWGPFLRGGGTVDPWFAGEGAQQGFAVVESPAVPYTGNIVPVENTGGAGTRNAHWRESVLQNELMTGFYRAGTTNPLSAITAASMRDLGYEVDDTRSDGFTLPLVLGGFRLPGGSTLDLDGDLRTGPITLIDPSGRVVGRLVP